MSRADKYEHLKKLIQAFSEPYRGTVYHYTSAEGISGIIDKHEIWMSNTAFMNDTTELKELEKATGIKDSDFTNDAVKEAWRKMRDRTPNPTFLLIAGLLSQKRAEARARCGFVGPSPTTTFPVA